MTKQPTSPPIDPNTEAGMRIILLTKISTSLASIHNWIVWIGFIYTLNMAVRIIVCFSKISPH